MTRHLFNNECPIGRFVGFTIGEHHHGGHRISTGDIGVIITFNAPGKRVHAHEFLEHGKNGICFRLLGQGGI